MREEKTGIMFYTSVEGTRVQEQAPEANVEAKGLQSIVVVPILYCQNDLQIPFKLGNSKNMEGWIGYDKELRLPKWMPADTGLEVSIALLVGRLVSEDFSVFKFF